MRVSIVIPVHNEVANVRPLLEELRAAIDQVPGLEAVIVDDGSTDGTWDELQRGAAAHSFVKAVRIPRNRGQSAALLLGIRHARGDVIVTMDGDLQNDPRDIPRLVERLAVCDVVCGIRSNRRDSWSRRMGSRVANRVRNWVTHDGVVDTGCSLKAFRRECAGDLPPLDGMHRFMPAYFELHGRRIEQVSVNHRPRRHGSSKYTNLKRLPRTIFDLVGFYWYRKRLVRGDNPQPSDPDKHA